MGLGIHERIFLLRVVGFASVDAFVTFGLYLDVDWISRINFVPEK